jgi:hypothetical protein
MSKAAETERDLLAWAGWQAPIPEDWRPLRIAGTWERGLIVLGDAEKAILQVKWWRPREKRFKPDRWFRRRLRRMGGKADAGGPRPKDFPHAAWVKKYQPSAGGRGSLWYGYAPKAGLTLEVLISGAVGRRDRWLATSRVLRSLKAGETGAPTRWSIYGASFEAPAGHLLCARRLKLGDVALRFATRGERLTLRQVYPARLALVRRKLPLWLDFPVFKEHRKFRAAGPDESWEIESFGRRLEGLRRTGRKRFPFPLGHVRARHTQAGVLHDEDLGRLLIAEHDTRRAREPEELARWLGRMNWARLAGGTDAA